MKKTAEQIKRDYGLFALKVFIALFTFMLAFIMWQYFTTHLDVSKQVFGNLMELNPIVMFIIFGLWFTLIVVLKKYKQDKYNEG